MQTHLPTDYPVHYYGSPDCKVYLIYTLPYKTPLGIYRHEFIIARHEEFSYNYKEQKLIDLITNDKNPISLDFAIDKPFPRIKRIKIIRNCKTYEDAEEILNVLIYEEFLKNPR